MAAVSSPFAALTSGGSTMAAEAQRLMALSVNKIIASRSRRCGISLHRNLLVAGVLFRARDALLAAGKMNASLSASSTSPSPSAPETQRDQADEASDDDDAGRSTSSPSASASSAEVSVPHQSQQPTTHSESAADSNPDEPSSTRAAADDCTMDVDVVGKENVPPTPAAVQPTATAEFSKPAADAEECSAIDNGLEQHVVAVARKRRCSESRTASCPIVSKSAKTTGSSSSNLAPSAADSRTRSSSVPACSSHASPKRVVDASKSSPSGTRTAVVNPVVYLNRVDVTFCSTPNIGGGFMGSCRPVLVVQVV